MTARSVLARSWLPIACAIVSVVVIELTSRALFVAGGSDAATVIWGPLVARGLVAGAIVVVIVGIAVNGGIARQAMLMAWLLVLGLATHRVAYDAPSGRVEDRWFGVVVRSQAFGAEQVSGLRRCDFSGAAGICTVGGGAAFGSLTLLPPGPLVADADGRLVGG